MPPPRGQSVSTHCFVNADHAGNTVTRRSQTSLLLFVNRAPIVWFSKQPNTVETSMFSSDFIIMKTAIKLVESLCYKLRMFGIPVEDPMNIFCDNESIFKNMTIPDLTLKKKHTSIVVISREKLSLQGQCRWQRKAQQQTWLTFSPSPRQKQDKLSYLSGSCIRWGVGFHHLSFPLPPKMGKHWKSYG